jgi:hypothetical protein
MSNAYEAWKQLQERMAGRGPLTDDSAEFLALMEENLRPAALKSYLEDFAGFDIYEEPKNFSEEEIHEFLVGLDDLRRNPAALQIAEAKGRHQGLFEAMNIVQLMTKLNWTGDHLYGDALADAETLIRAELNGQPKPMLDRFRCPSEFETSKHVKVRCQYQLPHGGMHRFVQSGDGRGCDWADEASVNPPKAYDEPAIAVPVDRCRSIEPSGGVLQCQYVPHSGEHRNESVTWSSEARSTRCQAYHVLRHPGGEVRGTVYCLRDAGHEGMHESHEHKWPAAEQNLCSVADCVRELNHNGVHRDADGKGLAFG